MVTVPRIRSAAIPSALFRKTVDVEMEISAVMSFKATPFPLLSLNEQLDTTKDDRPEIEYQRDEVEKLICNLIYINFANSWQGHRNSVKPITAGP